MPSRVTIGTRAFAVTDFFCWRWPLYLRVPLVPTNNDHNFTRTEEETSVQIVRLYSGDDGESHLENLNLDQLSEMLKSVGDGPIKVSSKPADSYTGFHNAPSRLFIVQLAGEIVYETADGSKTNQAAGDVLVAEDSTGRGHTSTGVGSEERVYLVIPLSGKP